ncbi:hypothetical protein GUJ93_ZPchr0006g46139 [Zizania palustris]|uniref:Uncharacterized protein n=1 Tax=Zizania palustris TaxID=103762 RepID=A0A8J5SQI9_ZIZPA|nr:hypothetical protein GUJ93_ZPchr0006g46139 [Zizania palustris]
MTATCMLALYGPEASAGHLSGLRPDLAVARLTPMRLGRSRLPVLGPEMPSRSIIVKSQFEWKQQLVNELESTSHKQKHISSRGELVKDKIILSQEKMIQRLNEYIQNLQQQLLQCCGNIMMVNSSGSSLISYISEIQRQKMMDD